jgi:hypothetical protein
MPLENVPAVAACLVGCFTSLGLYIYLVDGYEQVADIILDVGIAIGIEHRRIFRCAFAGYWI